MTFYPSVLKNQAEAALADPHFDFIATYHAVSDLRRLAKQNADVLDKRTVANLENFLRADTFRHSRQAYFLYREAAKGLTDMIRLPGSNGLGSSALASLIRLLATTTGSAHRGIAEALGSLPLQIIGPQVPGDFARPLSQISWDQLLWKNHLSPTGTPRFIGRSLVAPLQGKRVLVVKLARQTDTSRGLGNEVWWMKTLKQRKYAVDCRFHLPRPLSDKGCRILRVNRLPLPLPRGFEGHPDGLAIAFIAHKDYFVYPNHHRTDAASAREMLERNAFLLGRLTAKGIIHDAPIPLFHNRTQRLRRDDQGRYQWYRAGRLDQWLNSCAFPNLGLSGLRDFEHLQPFSGHGPALYRHIGTHLFSLMLVAGSYFRCRERSRVGLDEKKQPVDARDLFDREMLTAMVQAIFDGYCRGFSATQAAPPLPVNLNGLTNRMIEEMGVDRYMTELLRRTDQQELSDDEFAAFLKTKGYSKQQIISLTRGQKDILLTSGPHLGDFNRQISLPELIECTATMAAVCIAGRYITMQAGRSALAQSIGPLDGC